MSRFEGKGLTIRQPWLQMFVMGLKHYETRSRKTSYRGPILLVSGKSMDPITPDGKQEQQMMTMTGSFPLGVAVCSGILTDCVPITEEFIASLSEEEKLTGIYTVGRYAWKIENIQSVDPEPMRGYPWMWAI